MSKAKRVSPGSSPPAATSRLSRTRHCLYKAEGRCRQRENGHLLGEGALVHANHMNDCICQTERAIWGLIMTQVRRVVARLLGSVKPKKKHQQLHCFYPGAGGTGRQPLNPATGRDRAAGQSPLGLTFRYKAARPMRSAQKRAFLGGA